MIRSLFKFMTLRKWWQFKDEPEFRFNEMTITSLSELIATFLSAQSFRDAIFHGKYEASILFTKRPVIIPLFTLYLYTNP
jgi:hypothetical protein